MAEARHWLDMMIGHQSARMRTPWLIADTVNIALVATQQAYDLRQEIGAQTVPDGLQFIVSARLYNPATSKDVRRIDLLKREEWEDIPDKTRTGEPESAWVDRTRWPIMHVHPVPLASPALEIRLVYQRVASNFATRPFNDRTYAMHECWNLWVVAALAAQIGNGPVRKLPADEVKQMNAEAARLLLDLEAYDQFEQADEPRQVAYWDGVS